MTFDDLSLRVKVLIGLVAPPICTVVCWLVGRRLGGSQREGARVWNESGFWAMLIAAYLIFGLALVGSRFFATKDVIDPASQVVQ
jgi:hypothetical protein